MCCNREMKKTGGVHSKFELITYEIQAMGRLFCPILIIYQDISTPE